MYLRDQQAIEHIPPRQQKHTLAEVELPASAGVIHSEVVREAHRLLREKYKLPFSEELAKAWKGVKKPVSRAKQAEVMRRAWKTLRAGLQRRHGITWNDVTVEAWNNLLPSRAKKSSASGKKAIPHKLPFSLGDRSLQQILEELPEDRLKEAEPYLKEYGLEYSLSALDCRKMRDLLAGFRRDVKSLAYTRSQPALVKDIAFSKKKGFRQIDKFGDPEDYALFPLPGKLLTSLAKDGAFVNIGFTDKDAFFLYALKDRGSWGGFRFPLTKMYPRDQVLAGELRARVSAPFPFPDWHLLYEASRGGTTGWNAWLKKTPVGETPLPKLEPLKKRIYQWRGENKVALYTAYTNEQIHPFLIIKSEQDSQRWVLLAQGISAHTTNMDAYPVAIRPVPGYLSRPTAQKALLVIQETWPSIWKAFCAAQSQAVSRGECFDSVEWSRKLQKKVGKQQFVAFGSFIQLSGEMKSIPEMRVLAAKTTADSKDRKDSKTSKISKK